MLTCKMMKNLKTCQNMIMSSRGEPCFLYKAAQGLQGEVASILEHSGIEKQNG